MSIRKSKVFAVAAAACVLGMMLGGCGSSTSGNATEGSNVITAFDSEPQNGLIPGNTNETGGGRPIDLLFAGLVSFDKDGKAQNEVAESITAHPVRHQAQGWLEVHRRHRCDRRVLHQGLELYG